LAVFDWTNKEFENILMNRLILISTVVLASSAIPCFGQESNVRVINQSSNGLAYPSSSYIGPGTLSKTAQQGAGYAPQNNPGLPKVNHGGYFGTPGDNLYSGNPDLSQHPQSVRIQQPNRIIYRQAPQETAKTKEKEYVPDPNIPMNYSDYKPDSSIQNDNHIAPSNNGTNIDSKNILPTKN
jgi:hypothetical protein